MEHVIVNYKKLQIIIINGVPVFMCHFFNYFQLASHNPLAVNATAELLASPNSLLPSERRRIHKVVLDYFSRGGV